MNNLARTERIAGEGNVRHFTHQAPFVDIVACACELGYPEN
jgi:hypothetical protein